MVADAAVVGESADFHERVIDVFGLEGRERKGFVTRKFFGVTNPLMLPDHSGVRDYDINTLDGGHLLVMLTNAKWIAGKQIFAARLKTPKKEALLAELNTQDRWYPRETPPAFEVVVLKDGPPTEAEMVSAIQHQFDCVLRREATAAEVKKYLELLRSSIELGGNIAGLQQMLTTVLLESEFLYRMEFGDGEVDECGRAKLTPHEAARAIAYALGDRGPDAMLRQAARVGNLATQEDFRREVTRLLEDDTLFTGPVDPSLNGKNMRTHESTHPKQVRFFREFFGYPNAIKIFKDVPRSDGYWQNPSAARLGHPAFWSRKPTGSSTGIFSRIRMSSGDCSPRRNFSCITTRTTRLAERSSRNGPRCITFLRIRIGRPIRKR